MDNLSIVMHKGFALVIEVNLQTETDRTIVAVPHMLPEGLFLRTLVTMDTFTAAVRVVDAYVLEEAEKEQAEALPDPPAIEGPDEVTEGEAIE